MTKKLWRIPPKLWRYLIGTEGYSGSDAEAKWLGGELNRIAYVDRLKEEVSAPAESVEAIRQEMRQRRAATIRQLVESAWVTRLKKHAFDPGFLKTWQRAQELLTYRLPEPKSCLAEAYFVLTKAGESTDPPEVPGPETDFLQGVGGKIDTMTVRQ